MFKVLVLLDPWTTAGGCRTSSHEKNLSEDSIIADMIVRRLRSNTVPMPQKVLPYVSPYINSRVQQELFMRNRGKKTIKSAGFYKTAHLDLACQLQVNSVLLNRTAKLLKPQSHASVLGLACTGAFWLYSLRLIERRGHLLRGALFSGSYSHLYENGMQNCCVSVL